MYDALVIGGGPSGSVVASLLVKAGWSVVLIEKKEFPRRKVCGEYISAVTLSLLPELGIAHEFLSLQGPGVKQVQLYAANIILSSSMPRNKDRQEIWGHALGREHLDTILIQEAVKSGATILQPWTACDLDQRADHFVCTIKAKEEMKDIAAKVVIMAHGSWEKQGWHTAVNPHKPSDLLAFKAHFTESKLKIGSMPLLAFPGGYGGMVHTDNGRTSLSCCIRRDQLKLVRNQYTGMQAGDALLQYLFEVNRGVRESLSLAKREGNWLSVGPIQPGIRSAYKNGIFYVGNIVGEAHPIIAEGISMAIQSAWMLSKILITHKEDFGNAWKDQAGNDYQRQWRKAFSRRIHAAAFFARLASNRNAMHLLLPIIKHYPKLLSWGAKLSGKIEMPLERSFP